MAAGADSRTSSCGFLRVRGWFKRSEFSNTTSRLLAEHGGCRQYWADDAEHRQRHGYQVVGQC